MYFIVLGVSLMVMWLAELGPVGAWPWYAVLWPFAAAAVWWAWADATGYGKRREMEKMDARVAKRREDNLASLGLDKRGRRGKSKR